MDSPDGETLVPPAQRPPKYPQAAPHPHLLARPMHSPIQVVKMLMTEEVRGRSKSVYGMRLKNNIANRKRADALGAVLHRTQGVIKAPEPAGAVLQAR